jgi:hypothetical protein
MCPGDLLLLSFSLAGQDLEDFTGKIKDVLTQYIVVYAQRMSFAT